jgi:hypothetical protein
MRGDYHRGSTGIDEFEQVDDFASQCGIEVARRLVRQQHDWSVDDRPRNANALLLPRRQTHGQLVTLMFHADCPQRFCHLALDIGAGDSLDKQWQCHVVEHRFFLQQPKILEDRSDLAPMVGNFGALERRDVLPVHEHLAGIRPLSADQHAEQCRLPGSARTH